MADDRPYSETLKVPAILVMPGDPWPTEFYARYPNAFRVPARIVWREGSPGRGRNRAGLDQATTSGQPGGDVASADAPCTYESRHAPSVSASTPVPVAETDHGRGNPIGAFLRVNDMLDRLQGMRQPEAPSGRVELAAAGDLRCDGFSGGCQDGGSRGTTAAYRITGRSLCAACAEKFLGITDEPGSDRSITLAPFSLKPSDR